MVRRIGALFAALAVSMGMLFAVMPATVASGATAATAAKADAYGSWPCKKTWATRACVDLSAKRAWLKYKGTGTVYGPVTISSGKPGYRTPTGTFTVKFKDKDYYSKQYNGPMPYSVFFTWQGHAFHYGSVQSGSHGCIRNTMTPAKKFFWHLQVDDKVQIVA